MSRLHKILAILFLLVWVPITSHCQLESIPGLGFLHCSSDTAENSHCEGDECSSVESGAYKIQNNNANVPLPFFTIALFDFTLPELTTSEDTCAVITSAPLEFQVGWQFSSRVALPPRAPSFASKKVLSLRTSPNCRRFFTPLSYLVKRFVRLFIRL